MPLRSAVVDSNEVADEVLSSGFVETAFLEVEVDESVSKEDELGVPTDSCDFLQPIDDRAGC
jgi:hypothetical protein